MEIRQIEPGDAVGLGRWYDLRVVVARHDLPDCAVPGRREHLARFEYLWPSVDEEAVLAWDGGLAVGAASYELPQVENLRMVYLDLIVHPEHRRRGIGTRLLDEVYAAARRHGRSLIEVHAVRTLPGGVTRDEAGYRYLTNRAHQPGATDIRSRLDLDLADTEAILGEARAHAGGYSLVQWRDAVPDELVDDVAALQSRLMLDAPTGDLAVEQQVYDAARVRRQEATELGRGHRSYSTAARHDATGRIVARTKLAFEADDNTHARQRTTIVEPTHRGHRLGLLVKAANHAYAESNEPALRAIDAWNAEDNTPMRAVNTALGFRPVDRWSVFQLPVPAP
ncbi:GNAT family N-acetyltransferase [Kribbella lupini]|uniref:GNAT family N-acetyltransferase n=1 Tax=Kribbella lupini TaxID=291602 RepID=A0ABN2CC15_9ACTN